MSGMTRHRLAAAGCTAFAALAFAASAAAEERTCRGAIGATSVDNLRVPQNATCELRGTHVKGTVKVERGAVLRAFGVRVVGNVQAENALRVVVRGDSRIGGSVQVKQGGSARVSGSAVEADIQFDQNTSSLLARNNRVGGSIQVVVNSGGATVASNRIDGNLQCKENSSAPTGGGNVVGGNKEDQCAEL
jgi:hypothetical protein